MVISSAGSLESSEWTRTSPSMRNLVGTQMDDYIQMIQLLRQNNLTAGMWRWSVDGNFSIKSFYNFLISGGITPPFQHIWLVPVPLEIRMLMQLVL